MEIEISKINSTNIDDFIDLIKLFKDVFESDNSTIPESKHLQKLLDDFDFIAFVAKANKKVVGGLTAYVLHRYDSEKPSAYIYDIAVTTHLQRKGIGKLLIVSLKDYCLKNGFVEMFVQAETDDHQAVNFYKTTPISSEMKATHFTYSFNN